MNVIDFPGEPGEARFKKMGGVYADMQDMTEAELDLVARYVDAVKLARGAPKPAQVAPLRRQS